MVIFPYDGTVGVKHNYFHVNAAVSVRTWTCRSAYGIFLGIPVDSKAFSFE